jgi:glycosyltransferase involved in cell wall biosynthesis
VNGSAPVIGLADLDNHEAAAALIAATLDGADADIAAALRARARTFLLALGREPDDDDLSGCLQKALAEPDLSLIWLLSAVLTGKLPHHPDVENMTRLARLDGPLDIIADLLTSTVAAHRERVWPAVEVITAQVLVDLHHTAQARFATGIQRVAREAALRWDRDHNIIIVGWTDEFDSLRRLDPGERDRALHGAASTAADPAGNSVLVVSAPSVLVPWECTVLVPELPVEPDRALAFQALARHSRSTVALIGHDCVPLTTSETTADGMGAAFALMLSAVTYIDRIAAVSHSSAREYIGWRRMLAGTGLSGPRIEAIGLASHAQPAAAQTLDAVRIQLATPGVPMVLVVGSHEPRKNHLAILQACELLWRRGLEFSVVFIGGNSWSSDRFTTRLRQLQAQSRPAHSVLTIDDDTLWAAYRTARCTLFPSLNEGFGLPVAESLACGTPVITSNFGSMAETSAHGGVLAVDPRDDHALAAALERMLTDEDLYANLKEQARLVPSRSWDDYAAETWEYLVHGKLVHGKLVHGKIDS